MTAPAPLPLIDVGPLVSADPGAEPGEAERAVGRALDAACRTTGFFVIEGHGVDGALLDEVDELARAFFALPDSQKAQIEMRRGGRAWRGWFPEGGELTSGKPDRKEGIYFGRDLPPDDPRVRAGVALHGPNLVPAEPAGLGRAVQRWMEEMERLGWALLRGIALGLDVEPKAFAARVGADPTVLFRVFRYPPQLDGDDGWGVAEHTDYGLLTILAHDGTPALSVRGPDGWIDVDVDRRTFVINLGEVLERFSRGRYRSTPHRVRHVAGSGRDRLSFPFFFDPAWTAAVGDRTYGEVLTDRVAGVFPHLAAEVGVTPS